LKKESD
jgi:hypothetical protein